MSSEDIWIIGASMTIRPGLRTHSASRLAGEAIMLS